MNPLSWAPVTPYGIDKTGVAHYSGRVTDVLTFGNAVVIATQWGGVWVINKDVAILGGFETHALSDAWADPDVSSLANGPDDESQMYAGCDHTLTYFELANGSGGPQTSLVANIPFPVAIPSTFYRIVVDASHRRIIVATGVGVWWSAIPTSPGNVTAYQWQQATGLPGSRVAGLCAAKDGAVHAAPWGDGTSGSSDYGIFKGTFSGGALAFARSTLTWHDGRHKDQMTRVSLASCASNRDIAFAACSDPAKAFRGVMQYDAASDTWTDTRNTITFASTSPALLPGNQGTFNNCIAVAPDNGAVVAFGWQHGTYVLRSNTWTLLDSVHTHPDMHGLLFVNEHTLYVGGDGGIIEVDQPTHASPSFDDRLNVFLPDLLFSHQLRNQYATTDASHNVDGLISGGLQDNGVKYLKTTPNAYTSWLPIEKADGGTNVFLTNGVLVCREANKSSRFRAVRWNASANDFDASFAIPIDVTVPDVPRMDVCSRVIAPSFKNSKSELMHAVSAAVQSAHTPFGPKGTNIVVGLFGDKDLNAPHWAVIGTMAKAVTAVGSMTGDTVFVGVHGEGISTLDVAGFLAGHATFSSPVTLPDGLSGDVIQFEVVSASLAFALFGGKTTTGRLVVFDGQTWKEIPLPVSEIVYSFAVDWNDATIWIATDTSVYQGVQNALGHGPIPIGFNTSFSWMNNSSGLPARPHSSHLRLGQDAGSPYLYLATYGRSVYRAAVSNQTAGTPSQKPGAGAKAGVKILFGVIQDGDGIEFDPSTGKFIIVPPRQPVETVLGDLFTSESLRASGAKAALTERRAALQRISDFVKGELGDIKE